MKIMTKTAAGIGTGIGMMYIVRRGKWQANSTAVPITPPDAPITGPKLPDVVCKIELNKPDRTMRLM
jgi:hypothetical protein